MPLALRLMMLHLFSVELTDIVFVDFCCNGNVVDDTELGKVSLLLTISLPLAEAWKS